MSIGVIGEALMDLIPQQDGALRPLVGGSPFNVARAVGCQGVGSHYLSPLSNDQFGDLLFNALQADDVKINAERSMKPTSMAIVGFTEAGQPKYSFYREGVADRDYTTATFLQNLPADITTIHTGSLAVVPADAQRISEVLVAAREQGLLISLDINMRPNVVADMDSYIRAIWSLLPLCDLVKASDEDLELLGLQGSAEALCQQLRQKAPSASLVAITLGPHGAIASTPTAQVQHSGFRLDKIADTVGAGDCFQAGLLSALYEQGFLTVDKLATVPATTLQGVVERACATAALNVMRQGCQPPSAKEVTDYIAEQKSAFSA